jgi:hypothetical protein
MDFATHFQMLARYNRIANERLYTICAQLPFDAHGRKTTIREFPREGTIRPRHRGHKPIGVATENLMLTGLIL